MGSGNVYFNNNISSITLGLKYDNLEYQEKIGQIDLEKLSGQKTLDSFEKGNEITDILYECYQNYQVKKGMPKSVFGDQFGYDMQKEISNCLTDFYTGKISQSKVEEFFEECCTSMRKFRTQQYQTSGNDALDKQQIVSQMYEIFAKENARAARNANYSEGEALNQTYGRRNDDWVYYNSDYYYQCEDMKEAMQNAVLNMTNKWEVPAIDTEEVEKNSIYTLDGVFDFNSGWNYSYRNQVGRASMEDESLIPPKNFKFFYKENSFPDQGNLWLSLNNRQTNVKVPFIISQTGSLKGQIFYVYDLLDDSFKVGDITDQHKSFINNFAVFTRWYSWESKINNIFGNFISQKS